MLAGNQIALVGGNPVRIDALIVDADVKIRTARDMDVKIQAEGQRRTVKGAPEVGTGCRNSD